MTKVRGLSRMYYCCSYQRTNAAATSTVSGQEVPVIVMCRNLDGVVSHERMRGDKVYVRAGRFKISVDTISRSNLIR